MNRYFDAEIGGADPAEPKTAMARGVTHYGMNIAGRPWSEIREDLIARKSGDYEWRRGRIPLYVYHDSDELLTVCREAYSLYFSENALGQRAFPSLARMEDEVIRASLVLFNAPGEAGGSFTSGGTESLFLALKTARTHFRSKHSASGRPTAIVPRTAHPAFDKAADYLDVDIVRVDVDDQLRVEVAAVADAVDERTMLIAGSAPCYPYGVFDPIAALGALALSKNLWLHVDACLGGFIAPFARDEGYPIPEFDFKVPGVTSLSADIHKYGFGAKGASILMHRSANLLSHQRFSFNNWPRGTYSTDTFLGTRPGGAIASAWAVMQYLGISGYRRLARKTMDAKQKLIRGINRIEGLEVVSPSELCIVLTRSSDKRVDINAVAEALSDRGWFVGRSREPQALHFALNAVHAPFIDEYLMDLERAVGQVRESGMVGANDDETY